MEALHMIRTSKAAFLATALLAGGAVILGGCSSAERAPSPGEGHETTGEIGLALTTGGATLNSASYAITGPGGFSKTGTIDVSHSTTLSATIGGLPSGNGFSITVSATATDGATSCLGSASFNVAAHATTTVNLHLLCHEQARTGGVTINGSLNVCSVLDAVSATPNEVIVGGSLSLSASAHDSDSAPAALSYHWSAASGSFSDPSSASPSFTCLAPGLVTVSVSASDGDPAASCADSGSVQIECSVPGAGSASPATLAVYGDAPYVTTPTDTSQTLATPAFVAAVNADPAVSLVLHVGDIHSGKQFCTEAYDRQIFGMWQSYQDPLVYIPR
jgi:hypothetical protein